MPEPISSISGVDELLAYIRRELESIQSAFTIVLPQPLEWMHEEPKKLYAGLTVGADGTDWNPGSGQGVYTYYNSSWHKLG